MTTQEKPERHHLYRHFASDGTLLYVGVSLSALHRLSGHKDHSHWFGDIARVDIQSFESRAAALAAERNAIKEEKPRYNIAHRWSLRDETKRSQHQARIDALRESDRANLLRRVVSVDVCYPENRLPLPLRLAQVRKYMADGKLGFIEFPNATGTKMKRYVTGWQFIDFVQWLESRDRHDREAASQ
jgi:hypothetical protein